MSKTSRKNETKHYLVRNLKLFLNLNNTYSFNVRNLTKRNVKRVNVFD